MADNEQQDRKITPFFIMAVRNSPDYAKIARDGKTTPGQDHNFISSDNIQTIYRVKEGTENGVSTVLVQGQDNVYYIPLSPEKLLALFRENGYRTYGPAELKKIAGLDHDDRPSLSPQPSTP